MSCTPDLPDPSRLPPAFFFKLCAQYSHKTRLVAVSKTKPVHLLKACYDAGHRDFGENYVQEIIEKAPQLPEDTRWHFIGPLQSNKVNGIIKKVPNLACIETVATKKLADKLQNACKQFRPEQEKLNVMVQVNTSGEAQKSGLSPPDAEHLVRHIHENCPNLKFQGLMTIGRYGDTSPDCFESLANCRDVVAPIVGKRPEELELSMGMSSDFELAIELGSTNVRVGSTIFGARDYGKK